MQSAALYLLAQALRNHLQPAALLSHLVHVEEDPGVCGHREYLLHFLRRVADVSLPEKAHCAQAGRGGEEEEDVEGQGPPVSRFVLRRIEASSHVQP